jgi:hypothetical protein
MKKFGLVTSRTAWKNKHSVEEIDYSILLTHVFGKPIATERAFMYFFRRYGLPNERHDDYNELCCYSFHTKDKDIIVRWRMGIGAYHHHLCAFVDQKDYFEYRFRPIDDWNNQIQAAAERDGLVYFGGSVPWSIYDEDENGKTIWIGNDIQKAAESEICKDYSDNDPDAWNKVFERMKKNDKEVIDKYKAVLPYPKIEYPHESFCCQFNNQIGAGKQQHEWILSLPESHLLRRVYFAVMELFEDWKRKTYIRDVYFDLTCEKDPNPKRKTAGYTDYSIALQGAEYEEA